MLKYIKITRNFLLLTVLTSGCAMDGNVTHELIGYKGEDPHQISVMGYLCNIGAVVEIQQAAAPYHDDSLEIPVPDVKVALVAADGEGTVTSLLAYSGKVFYTPPSFRPKQQVDYTLKVTAPGFDEVTSVPQKLPEPFGMDSIQILTRFEQNIPDFDPDTILADLFGQRTFYDVIPHYTISSKDMADGGCIMTLYSHGNTYRNHLYNYKKSTLPMDLLIEGSLFFFDYPRFNFSDLIATGDTMYYAGNKVAILDRVDSIRFQAFCFDSLNVRFYEEQADYLYSNEPYFSIVTKTMSNMSNGIGLFITGWVAAETMYFEKPGSDSLNIYQP